MSKWIPVSKKPPKIPCLATDKFEQVFIPVGVVCIGGKCYDGRDFHFDIDKFLKGKAVTINGKEKAYELPREIIAWRPLPKPYREETE